MSLAYKALSGYRPQRVADCHGSAKERSGSYGHEGGKDWDVLVIA